MQRPTDETTSVATAHRLVGGNKARGSARGSWMERIADGTYVADAHALAQSFLEYLEHLAGPD
jgi:hypothetical protein